MRGHRAAAVQLTVLALALAACRGEGARAGTTKGPSTSHDADTAESKSPPQTSARGAVVVAIVVDQLSAWIAEERLPKLPPTGFFARMTREGTWVRAMRYPYAITDTAPGHAALHTGKVPSETHIVVNETPDEQTGIRTSFFRDPRTRLVAPDGVRSSPGSSASALAVPTVADRLRAARPDARIVSISLKDRAALLPAGKRPTHALWFDVGEGAFVTSTAIEPTFPAWARPLAEASAIARLREETWVPLDVAWLAENAGKDVASGEGDLDGLGVAFPHHARSAKAFRATPMSDTRILELALAAAQQERDPQQPLLLLLSMSASDVLGHTFGPSSWEAWDHLRRLDASLASFLTALEAVVGPARVILSGDHGNSAMPEARVPLPAYCKTDQARSDAYDRPFCAAGARLEPNALRAELRAAVARSMSRSDLVAGVSDGYVFLTRAARALEQPERDALDRVVRGVLAQHGAEIAEVFHVGELASRCPRVMAGARGIPDRARPGEDLVTLVCRSWADGAGAGDYFVVPAYGSFFDGEVVPGKGASHGTPWLYDRTVPLFLRAPGAIDAGRLVVDPVDFSAYAALEAALLGLDPRPAGEILDALRAR